MSQPGSGTVWGLTDTDRLRAIALVRTGTVYDLGVPLDSNMPQGPRDTFGGFRVTQFRTPRALREQASPPPFDFSMEIVTASIHQGTHIDGLAHIHSRGQMHGGYATAQEYTDFGWRRGGAEHIPAIISRGVLLDVAGVIGPDPLPERHEITAAELARCREAEGVALRPGDVVLVRTGRIGRFKAGLESYFDNAPGVGRDAAIWLHEQGMTALGTDTSGTEPQPVADDGATTHVAMLVDRGVLLLEILDLDSLSAAGVYEFCFACLPLPIVGATGSWARPVALC
jgi:kynurenine formamidase